MKKFEFDDFGRNCKEFLQMNSNQSLLQAIYLFTALNSGRIPIQSIEEYTTNAGIYLINKNTVVDTHELTTCDIQYY